MAALIRSSGSEPFDAAARRQSRRGMDAVVLRTLVGFSVCVAALFLAVPAHADEIEPEPEAEPAPKVQSEPEPEPEPKTAAAAEPEEEEPDEPSWIPSLDIGVDVFDYNADVEVQNHINPPSYQGKQHEAERQTMLRIGGELMGPMFEDLPGRPRLFVQGGAHFQMFSSDKIFRDGDPYVKLEPERSVQQYYGFGVSSTLSDLPGDFTGQGSEISARFDNPSWYAGLGVAFSVPIASNLLLYIKPSIQYGVEKIDLPAGLTTVDEPIPRIDDPEISCGLGKDPPIPCSREFFIYRSRATKSTTDHHVGAGLEVALVPFRLTRPIRVTLYAQARFLWLVSDDTHEYGDPAGVATYIVERDNFGIRGGGGLRFSWMGFD